MSRVKKNLLGAIGLFLVATMTTVAAQLPDSTVSASGDVVISVTVQGVDFFATILNPSEGEQLSSATGTSSIEYGNATSLEIFLTNHKTGTTTSLGTVTPADLNTAIENVAYSLPNYGEYTISVEGEDPRGTPVPGPTVTFQWRAIWIEVIDDGKDDGNPNIIIHINDPDVDHVVVEIVDEDGNTHEIVVPITPEDIINGEVEVELPFVDEGIGSGDYDIIATPYDDSGNAIDDPYTVGIVYIAPEEIDVPQTGLFGIDGLVLSRTDYVVTGLFIFGVAILLAIYLLRRKSDRGRP